MSATKTIGFSVAGADMPRLDRLVEKYGHGNRSEFLREAIRQMEVVDRAQRLSALQGIGTAHSSERGASADDVNAIVRKVLAKRR